MIEPPSIVRIDPRPIAVIHVTVDRAQIQQVMGPGVSELFAAVHAQGIAVTGPWFTHHSRRPTDSFDFDIGVPVASPVAPVGRMRAATWPSMRVARTVMPGDFSGLADAWGQLHAWIAANGHTPTEDLWEVYLAGPESSPDPAAWRTELNRPLLD